jgi:hypothetical protein
MRDPKAMPSRRAGRGVEGCGIFGKQRGRCAGRGIMHEGQQSPERAPRALDAGKGASLSFNYSNCGGVGMRDIGHRGYLAAWPLLLVVSWIRLASPQCLQSASKKVRRL